MRQLSIVLWLVLVVLAACAPEPAAQTVEEIPVSTPEEPTEVLPSPTPEPPTATPLSRPTLPPTWTPTPEPTVAPTEPTPTLDYVPNATTGADVRLGNCLQFGPDLRRNPNSVVVGNPVTVYWTPAGGGVFYYEVVLRDANGAIVDSSRRVPSSREYTFRANLFDFNSVYTWSVTPFNSRAEPICDTRTSEMRATLR